MDKRIWYAVIGLVVVLIIAFLVRQSNSLPMDPENGTGQVNGSGEEENGNQDGDGDESNDLIRVNEPMPNQSVGSPFTVSGEARGNWYFEASFPIHLYDSSGRRLATAIATAQGDWMTENFVPFSATVDYQAAEDMDGVLVLEKSNASGLAEHADEIRIPVRLEAAAEMLTVKAYFSNANLDPEVTCTEVFAVERQIPATTAVGRAALEELLKGVLPDEAGEGFTTNINEGVRIQSLVIENGIAAVDFNSALEEQVGGSCRTAAILAQITETLRQFPTVDQVVISIDGRTEDILQP